MHNKFYIGEDVVSKRTGFPGIGKVAGLCAAEPWALHSEWEGVSRVFNRWNNLYPEWRRSIIYFVWFNEARRTMTPEEVSTLFPDKNEIEIQEFWNGQKHHHMIAYVEDDLESTDDPDYGLG